jgi:hypothetical protein
MVGRLEGSCYMFKYGMRSICLMDRSYIVSLLLIQHTEIHVVE